MAAYVINKAQLKDFLVNTHENKRELEKLVQNIIIRSSSNKNFTVKCK